MASFEGADNPNYKTGLKTREGPKKYYSTWVNMRARCSNPRHPKYHRYGGRGIKVCESWQTIIGFSEWAEPLWSPGMTIDRIDNDGDYCPENCRFVSASENSRKKSTTKITAEQAEEIRSRKGESMSTLAREYGCNSGTIWYILNNVTHVADGECSRKFKERKNESKA